jgi:hypothetical protein
MGIAMNQEIITVRRPGRSLAVALGLLAVFATACADDADRVGPSTGTELVPASELGSAGTQPGIVFASSQLSVSQINSVHTGMVYTVTPSNVLSFLSSMRAKNGRVLIHFAGEKASRNTDGTFNLAGWKSQIDRFKNIDIKSYIDDGTIVAHYILDEPNFASRWGDKIIPQSTVEAAAKHSKLRWPTLPTVVNAPATWLAGASVTYTGLDAGWAMFRSKNGDPATWSAGQVRKAKSVGLGLVAGLNILDGGDGSSGIRGTQPNTWAMSAAELKSYGTALLSQSYMCAFSMWRYSDTYYNRTDVKSAMTNLSQQAKTHAKTSCKQ